MGIFFEDLNLCNNKIGEKNVYGYYRVLINFQVKEIKIIN